MDARGRILMQFIEKSAFRRGEYIAHLNGAQRIHRTACGWETYALASTDGKPERVGARTLRELDGKIGAIRRERGL